MLTIWTLPFKFRSPPLDSRFRLNHWWSPKGSSHPLRPPILPLLRSPIKRGHNGTPPTAPCPPPSLFRPNNFTLLQSALPRLSYLTRENILAFNNHQELQKCNWAPESLLKRSTKEDQSLGGTRKKALLKNYWRHLSTSTVNHRSHSLWFSVIIAFIVIQKIGPLKMWLGFG